MPEQGNSLVPDTPHYPDATQATPGTTLHIRALAQPFKKTQMITQDDGSLLIKGVPMLAAGTWTDSAVQTPLHYTEKALSEYATNWLDDTGWSRHLGGVPRDITEKVAQAINHRYDNGAVTADVLVHGATQKSRDTIELVKRKLINFVSVEHGGKERWNPDTRQMEAESLDFYGFAFVNKGACKLCRINESPAITEPVTKEDDTMELKELEAKYADMAKELAELKAAKIEPVTPPAPVVDNTKELEEAKAEIKALAAQVKELASQPAPTVTVPNNHEQIKELGKIDTPVVVWDKRDGTLRSV